MKQETDIEIRKTLTDFYRGLRELSIMMSRFSDHYLLEHHSTKDLYERMDMVYNRTIKYLTTLIKEGKE